MNSLNENILNINMIRKKKEDKVFIENINNEKNNDLDNQDYDYIKNSNEEIEKKITNKINKKENNKKNQRFLSWSPYDDTKNEIFEVKLIINK